MDEDTRIGVGVMWVMDKSGLAANVQALLVAHRRRCGCLAEIIYANPEDLVGVMPVANSDEELPKPLMICGVRVVPNISTQPGHLYAGVKKARTVAHGNAVMEEK